MLTVLLGGARSGKSAWAVRLGRRHDGAVTYLATSPRIDGDTDLDTRIATHRLERPASWRTIEEEVDLASAVDETDDSFLIVDCLTLWVNNLLHVGRDEAAISDAATEALAALGRRQGDAVVISNEVGLGIVPDNELGRRYRDVLGRVNQQFCDVADRALLLVAGRSLPLHRIDELGT